MFRDDLSNKLIHFTKGYGDKNTDGFKELAVERFFSILRRRELIGSNKNIDSQDKCVCFSESPIAKFPYIFNEKKFHYAPLGIMVDKKWLFEKGGRPVIYQSIKELKLLKDSLKYKHKSYNPCDEREEDFSWEREWRICTDRLNLEYEKTTIIVPNRRWEDFFKIEHKKITKGLMRGKCLYGDGSQDEILNCCQELKWHFIVLEDLGVHVPWDFELKTQEF